LKVWRVVLVVCVCVSVSGVLFPVGVNVCDLLICLHLVSAERGDLSVVAKRAKSVLSVCWKLNF